MPRSKIDYSKGMIYKIACNDPEIKDCYVGSTTDLARRRRFHADKCRKQSNEYLYEKIRENGGWGNWSVVLVESYPCSNSEELKARTHFYIRELSANLNYEKPVQPVQPVQPEAEKTEAETEQELPNESVVENKVVVFDKSIDTILMEKFEVNRKRSTAQTYYSRIRTVFLKGLRFDNIPSTYQDIVDKLSEHRDTVVEWIQTAYKVNMQTVTLRALLVLCAIMKEQSIECTELEEFYKKHYQKAQRQDQQDQVYRPPTEKQLEANIVPQDIIDKHEEVKGIFDTLFVIVDFKSFPKFRRAVILSFYRYLVPLRGQDFFSLKITYRDVQDDNGNFIDLKQHRLILNDYKTAKTHGQRIISIDSEELKTIIHRYINATGLKEGDYFLVKDASSIKEPITTQIFCNDLKTVLGISVNHLRNMYVSNFLRTHKKMVADGEMTQQEMIAKRKDLANKMAHSIATQETIYSKFENM